MPIKRYMETSCKDIPLGDLIVGGKAVLKWNLKKT
jgi:hypothetical protein